MFKSSFHSAFMKGNQTKRQEKQTGAQAAAAGAERLGRFGSAMKDKSKGDAVSRIQSYAKSEAERQKKKKQEEASKPKTAAPSKGFFGRMMDKYVYGKKEQ